MRACVRTRAQPSGAALLCHVSIREHGGQQRVAASAGRRFPVWVLWVLLPVARLPPELRVGRRPHGLGRSGWLNQPPRPCGRRPTRSSGGRRATGRSTHSTQTGNLRPADAATRYSLPGFRIDTWLRGALRLGCAHGFPPCPGTAPLPPHPHTCRYCPSCRKPPLSPSPCRSAVTPLRPPRCRSSLTPAYAPPPTCRYC